MSQTLLAWKRPRLIWARLMQLLTRHDLQVRQFDVRTLVLWMRAHSLENHFVSSLRRALGFANADQLSPEEDELRFDLVQSGKTLSSRECVRAAHRVWFSARAHVRLGLPFAHVGAAVLIREPALDEKFGPPELRAISVAIVSIQPNLVRAWQIVARVWRDV